MISDRGKGLHHLTLIGQCLLVTLTYWLWYWFCTLDYPHSHSEIGRYLVFNEFIVLGLIVGSSFSRVGAGINSPNFELASQRAFRQLLALLFYWSLSLLALRDFRLSLMFFLTFVPLVYVILVVSSRYLPVILGRIIFRNAHRERAILVGPPAKAARMRHWISNNRHLGFELVAELHVSLDGAPPVATESAALVVELEHQLTSLQASKLILAELPAVESLTRQYADLCERKGVRLLTVTDVDARFGRPVALFEENGLCFIGLREEPLEDPYNRFLKRSLDVSFSFLVLISIFPPACAIVWLVHRLQSPGPLFFRQERPGYQNHNFSILKFRTMHVDNPDENQLATRGDPRVFSAGRWLRKLSVDEIPQFWNVLRGEMSVVGPRPHLIAHNDLFVRFNNKAYVRYFVKPGITGLAQVLGMRGGMDSPEEVVRRVEADIHYLETWTIWKDIVLIAKTVMQMVAPPRKAV